MVKTELEHVLDQYTPYEVTVTAGDGAQTNAAISPAIGAARRFEVASIRVSAAAGNSVAVAVRVGFAAATLPAASTTPVVGIVLSHPGVAAGSGMPGDRGRGALGEELRLTCSAPTGGSITVQFLGRVI